MSYTDNIYGQRINLNQVQEDFDITFGMDENLDVLISRNSDKLQQWFSFTEIIDGTFDAWLAGATGYIVQMDYKNHVFTNLGFDNLGNYLYQPILNSNSGNPFVKDHTRPDNLYTTHNLSMSKDWILTAVMTTPSNSNNQSLSFGVRGTGTNLVGIALSNSNWYVVINRLTGTTGAQDYRVTISLSSTTFRLYTFAWIGGVFVLYENGVALPNAANNTWFIQTDRLVENVMITGNSSPDYSGGGKQHEMKHYGILTGEDLSGIDINTYNNNLITKYNL